jgi:hypothetical protein
MSDALGTYLHDHLAGAAYAIDLVELMRDQHKGNDLGEFAAWLLVEINADREVLRQLAERTGAASNTIKELTAWLGEKVSRLKLSHGTRDGLGIFEALEFLEVGIHGKVELWRALAAVAAADTRLQGIDFEQLVARAEKQRAMVENRRLELAYSVFGAVAVGKSRHLRKARSNKTRGKRVTGGLLVALAVIAAIELAPDVVRYMKIRAM